MYTPWASDFACLSKAIKLTARQKQTKKGEREGGVWVGMGCGTMRGCIARRGVLKLGKWVAVSSPRFLLFVIVDPVEI